jgi:crotonobetainyl-CoA:carnitine CoA-transferase CaiB-like acyl-CoA transferase
VKVPGLPVEIDGRRLRVRRHVPKKGEHTAEVLAELRKRT